MHRYAQCFRSIGGAPRADGQLIVGCQPRPLQYYIPALEAANKTKKPKFKLEYTTFEVHRLHPPAARDAIAPAPEDDSASRAFHYPLPLKLLPKSLRNATRTSSKFAPYKLPDLTVRSWTALAAKLGRGEKEKLRQKFRQYMYFGGDEG